MELKDYGIVNACPSSLGKFTVYHQSENSKVSSIHADFLKTTTRVPTTTQTVTPTFNRPSANDFPAPTFHMGTFDMMKRLAEARENSPEDDVQPQPRLVHTPSNQPDWSTLNPLIFAGPRYQSNETRKIGTENLSLLENSHFAKRLLPEAIVSQFPLFFAA
jgi:hypothetical protein